MRKLKNTSAMEGLLPAEIAGIPAEALVEAAVSDAKADVANETADAKALALGELVLAQFGSLTPLSKEKAKASNNPDAMAFYCALERAVATAHFGPGAEVLVDLDASTKTETKVGPRCYTNRRWRQEVGKKVSRLRDRVTRVLKQKEGGGAGSPPRPTPIVAGENIAKAVATLARFAQREEDAQAAAIARAAATIASIASDALGGSRPALARLERAIEALRKEKIIL